jgi:hypothetical protein
VFFSSEEAGQYCFSIALDMGPQMPGRLFHEVAGRVELLAMAPENGAMLLTQSSILEFVWKSSIFPEGITKGKFVWCF